MLVIILLSKKQQIKQLKQNNGKIDYYYSETISFNVHTTALWRMNESICYTKDINTLL